LIALHDQKFTNAHILHGDIRMEANFEATAKGALNNGAEGMGGNHGNNREISSKVT
jgi:hypothetical protein